MNLRSIGVRLTFWYVGLLAATLVILGGTSYFLLTYSLRNEIDVALNSVATALAERSKDGIQSAGPGSIDQIFRRHFGFVPLDPYFEMLDPAGKRPNDAERDRRIYLSQQALENAAQGFSTFETIAPPAEYPIRILTKPVIVDGQLVNLVQAGMSLERAHQTGRHFLLILTILLPVGLLLAAGGGWMLARRSLNPVRVMTQTLRRITAFKLSERLDETGTGDELDQLARTLNETLERLDSSFDQMRQFSADASHELQTPLTILKGEIEVALRFPRDAEEYRNTLASSLEEINRLAKLVEGLLLLARADSGVLKIDRQQVDLGKLIEAVMKDFSGLAAEQDKVLNSEMNEPVSLFGDPILLRQLLQNLVQNGLKYTPEGGAVTVKAGYDHPWSTITVSDTGEGIPATDQEKIFKRFFRSAKARSEKGGGAGLGLSIVHSIVDAHKGKIEVTSRPGLGSTFIVKLPAE